MWSARSTTGFTVTWVFGLPHHSRICSTLIGDRVLPHRPTVSVPVRASSEGGQPGPRLGRARRLEPEGELAAGKVAEGFGAAYVEGLGGAEVGLLLGTGPERVLEVEGVGEVDLGVDVDGAVEGDLVDVDIDVPLLRRFPPFGFGGFGVEPHHRFLDGAVQLRPGTRVRDRGEVLVDVRGTRCGEAGGVGGDPAGPPQRQPPFQHPSPEHREAVAQLEDPADLREPRLGGDTEGGGVLHQRELRDQRSTRTRDRQGFVGEEPDAVGRVGLVEQRPLDGQLGLLDLGSGDLGLLRAQHRPARQRCCRSVWVAVLVMRTIQAPSTDSQGLETGVIHRVSGHGRVTSFPLYYRGFEALGPRAARTQPGGSCRLGFDNAVARSSLHYSTNDFGAELGEV